ncbi:MAG: preprotein translocase subunit SecE [Coriobacteriales bacterium]|jgi:preprotein translocase subunit SecE|nr:preprotein translocase subunit SecE [Coriobacteriales bacterium]
MANKKKKKANNPKNVAAPASDKLAQDRAEFEASLEELDTKPAKESSGSSKSKEKAKDKGKDNKPVVIKSQSRAKDPKKANKKPNIFRRFVDYLKQVRLEIKRTTWPTKNEVLNMTIIVMVALLFFGVLIFVIDLIMVELLKLYGYIDLSGAQAADASLAVNGVDTGTAADINAAADAPNAADINAAADVDAATDAANAAGDTADTAADAANAAGDAADAAADTTPTGGE